MGERRVLGDGFVAREELVGLVDSCQQLRRARVWFAREMRAAG